MIISYISFKKSSLKWFGNFAILLIIVLSFSCTHSTTYDKQKWQGGDSGFPPEDRPAMLDNLIKKHKLKGLSIEKLTDLLGRPDYQEADLIIYNIELEYGGNTDVTYSKKLKFKLSKDSIITGFSIVEWGDK